MAPALDIDTTLLNMHFWAYTCSSSITIHASYLETSIAWIGGESGFTKIEKRHSNLTSRHSLTAAHLPYHTGVPDKQCCEAAPSEQL